MILVGSLGFTNHGPPTAYSHQVEFPNFPQNIIIMQQKSLEPDAWIPSWAWGLLAVKWSLTGFF